MDEVGRGAWAGPLVMGAVIFGSLKPVRHLRDSKMLTPPIREQLSKQILSLAIGCGIGVVSVEELNQLGLTTGLEVAAQRAVDSLGFKPDHLLFDGKSRLKSIALPQTVIVRGDQTVRCIAAASVIAKVYRDQLMRDLHASQPTIQHYRFDLNKGYPSAWHRSQLEKLGASAYHRTFFKPIADLRQLRIWPSQD